MAMDATQEEIAERYQKALQNMNQYTPTITTSGGTLGGTGYVQTGLGGYQYYPNAVFPTISPQQLPDPQEVKKNFEDYLKRYLALYSGMYTNPYEKELIENLRGLLVLDKVKSL